MHSKGYLFASCLKLSNNLLIKEDWKHSTSDLAVWGLQGPCCPQDSPWPPLLCSPGPLPAPGLRAQPQACRGSFWVTLGQSDLPEKEVGVPAIITGDAISAGLPRDGHDVYIHPVHRHCFSACCVRAGARAACWCVCPWAFSPAGPEHSAACCLQKEERKNGTAPPPSGQEKWQGRPLPFLSARV